VSRTFYFAYGSNMDKDTLRERRGIEWTRAVPALARGWRLSVNKPSLLGTGEAMATIVADPAGEVWGVLYEIATTDYEHLEFTEGVKIDHYRRVTVVVEPATAWDGVERGTIGANTVERGTIERITVEAVTLASDHRDPGIRPTRRYMNLLLAGAADHGLPASWIDFLRAIEAAEESADNAALRPFFDRAMRKPD